MSNTPITDSIESMFGEMPSAMRKLEQENDSLRAQLADVTRDRDEWQSKTAKTALQGEEWASKLRVERDAANARAESAEAECIRRAELLNRESERTERARATIERRDAQLLQKTQQLLESQAQAAGLRDAAVEHLGFIRDGGTGEAIDSAIIARAGIDRIASIAAKPPAEALRAHGEALAEKPLAILDSIANMNTRKWYLTECEHCGSYGSSEECGEISYGDDADISCGKCHQIIRGSDVGICDLCDRLAKLIRASLSGGKEGA